MLNAPTAGKHEYGGDIKEVYLCRLRSELLTLLLHALGSLPQWKGTGSTVPQMS